MIFLIIIIAFLFIYALLIFFYLYAWRSIKAFPTNENTAYSFISVIVPVRNEEKNIEALLNALSHQTFPDDHFEIIVVDDFSTDNTHELVNRLKIKNILLVQPDGNPVPSPKKRAIEAGISFAKGSLIVTTDADCVPDRNWLKTINDFYFQTGSVFIVAPVKFAHNNGLFQIFQSLDFLCLQGITAASVSSGLHMMCNGANLAFQLSAFKEVNGYAGVDNFASGDDMMLIYKMYRKYPDKIAYLKNEFAVMVTGPQNTLKSFLSQRKRWASKTFHYDDPIIILILAFVYFFNCLFPILIVKSFLDPKYLIYLLIFLISKTLIEWPFVYNVAKFYKEERIMRYFFIFQPVHIFYIIYTGFISQFGKYEWKGRRVQ